MSLRQNGDITVMAPPRRGLLPRAYEGVLLVVAAWNLFGCCSPGPECASTVETADKSATAPLQNVLAHPLRCAPCPVLNQAR